MLSLDNANGGIYNIEEFAPLPPEMDEYVKQHQFNFIPTYSSLDIGASTQNIHYSDLNKAYSPLSPPLAPKNTPFDNFYTNPTTSETHTQFTLRNGKWLMDELRGNTAFYSCISDCSSSRLPLKITGGTTQLCDNATDSYQLQNLNPGSGATVNWSIDPSGSVSNINANGNTVSITSSGNFNGWATLSASISTDCGAKIVEKRIYMGAQRPRLLDINGQEMFHIEGCTLQQYNISFQVPPGTLEWEWTKVSGSYNLTTYGNNFAIITSSQPAFGIFSVKVRDACGWSPVTLITVSITSCKGGFEPQFRTYPNPVNDVLTISQVNNVSGLSGVYANTQNFGVNNGQEEMSSSATLYDFNGNPVNTISPATGSINVESLAPGHYILVVSYCNETESHLIVVE